MDDFSLPYLVGLFHRVHLLNLVTLPAFGFDLLFQKYEKAELQRSSIRLCFG